MSAAARIAAVLGGTPERDGWRIGCPVHGPELTPSCTIWDAPYGLGAKCWSRGCEPKAVRAALVEQGIVDRKGLTRRLTEAEAAALAQEQDRARQNKIRAANDLYRWSKPHPGTLAERYLRRERGIAIELPSCIRFLPHGKHAAWKSDPCDWKERDDDKGNYYSFYGPALIAPLTDATGMLTAVHVILLDDGGAKRPAPDLPDALLWWNPKRTYGMPGTSAVQLADASEALGIAEGIEDALAATELRGVPCWAAGGAGRLHKLDVPSHVTELHIFADNDEAGERAASSAADFHEQFRRVLIRRPARAKDYNELLLSLRTEAQS